MNYFGTVPNAIPGHSLRDGKMFLNHIRTPFHSDRPIGWRLYHGRVDCRTIALGGILGELLECELPLRSKIEPIANKHVHICIVLNHGFDFVPSSEDKPLLTSHTSLVLWVGSLLLLIRMVDVFLQSFPKVDHAEYHVNNGDTE